MADHADMAEGFVQGALDDAAARAAAALSGPGAADCLTCEDPIPEARRKANPAAQRCAPCQRLAERGFRTGAVR